MIRKILVILGFVVICTMLSGYFYCADRYAASQTASLKCDKIDVIITNSHQQNFISEGEVADMVRRSAIGKRPDEVNIHSLEQRLCNSSAICKAEAYMRAPSTLVLEVTQRNPVVRFQTARGGFYCDSSGFILPLLGKVTLDLPVVSGKMMFDVPDNLSGYPTRGKQWLEDMIRLTETIRNNSYWSREIEQIWVDDNSDVVLYTRSCDEKFIFGGLDNVDSKMTRMAGYYRTIRPEAKAKGKSFKTVNLKFKDQIICK
jgi:cell division protein FtsQ